jgi:hypothetical protein
MPREQDEPSALPGEETMSETQPDTTAVEETTGKPATELTSFQRNRWQGLQQGHLPSSIMATGQLNLTSGELAVYAVLLHFHRNKMAGMKLDIRFNEELASVKLSLKTLMKYTGLSINSITDATKGLATHDLVEIQHPRKGGPTGFRPDRLELAAEKGREERNEMRWEKEREQRLNLMGRTGKVIPPAKRRRRGKNPENVTAKTNVYWLLKPGALSAGEERQPFSPNGETNIIASSGLPYFSYPACIITNSKERWSLSQMSGSETQVYFSVCWLSAVHWRRQANEFEVTAAQLRKISGIKSPKTFDKVLDRLESLHLILVSPSDAAYMNGKSKPIRVELTDPMTGCPIPRHNDPKHNLCNYRLEGRSRRPILNVDDAEQIEAEIREAAHDRGGVIERGNGELLMNCPFHSDSKPSLSANYAKRGCWRCFGCGLSGSIYELLAGLKGTSIGDEVIALAATRGMKLEYQDPDKGATIYRYMTPDGRKVLKEKKVVIKDGIKTITLRRPGPGGHGMINDANGVPASLYHVELLEYVRLVCITEGEKDSDTITNLFPRDSSNYMVGVTSGNADSWRPEFAKHLEHRNVVVMPDDDEAGKRYEADVIASLEAEGIRYRVVKFGDAGLKDVSDFLVEHTVDDLVERIGDDWLPHYEYIVPRVYESPEGMELSGGITI